MKHQIITVKYLTKDN